MIKINRTMYNKRTRFTNFQNSHKKNQEGILLGGIEVFKFIN